MNMVRGQATTLKAEQFNPTAASAHLKVLKLSTWLLFRFRASHEVLGRSIALVVGSKLAIAWLRNAEHEQNKPTPTNDGHDDFRCLYHVNHDLGCCCSSLTG